MAALISRVSPFFLLFSALFNSPPDVPWVARPMTLPPTFWNAAGALSVLAALSAPLSPLVILPSPSAAAAQRPLIFGAGEFPAVFSPIVDNGPRLPVFAP
ncbi:hypothetical protein AZSI13_23050 [Azospira sp. I13]|uniref:hypothetical protein n=1 Tax=Azospira sp. I13 TaxID=1765050 RepID=UPI000D43275C|nr:hypothetical protein [Azospira sp. I13]GBG02978.1 hypothetical protein AZSI13_23050 [Azospira sp. I13]